ncbi:DUF1885 family protein [Neobacillus muris]|uniref:DUF1885 family protein n=1 Tax=Neobacillus muris TaxID=2941334 RepID=UPI00203CFEF7|nr:DUF1885 family protein [Neobacillus muris]
MALNALVKLVPASVKQTITIEDVKELFQYYKTITAKAGDQLDWDYENAAFPYELKETPEGKGKWFYLESNHERYNYILVGVDQETSINRDGEEETYYYIQVTLPEQSTYGDKGKANEFCKFLAKKMQGELQLFNGRIMYFYPRK